jgi:beta-galactosidase
MLMLMGYTLDLPEAISADDIKRHVFTGLAANLKGFLFWQYRPEMLGREAPTWGLSHLDGSSTPWLEDFAEIGRVLQEHAGFVLDSAPKRAEVAVLYSPENQVFAWASTGNEKSATDSILGVHRALYERNHVIDLLHPKDFADGSDVLDQYRVIVVPFPYYLSERIADRLKAWIEAGGVLVGEAYFGGWDVEEGRHHTTLPGYGLHEVFGVRQKNAEPADEHGYAIVQGVTRAAEQSAVRAGITELVDGSGFVASQAVDPSGGLGQVEIVATEDLPFFPKGRKAYGALVKETFFVEGADVLATYTDGEPAVTRHAYGDGQAILIGSYVGLLHQRQNVTANADLLAGLVEHAVRLERPSIVGDGRVRVDVLTEGDDAMVIVRNFEGRPVTASVTVPGLKSGSFSEVFGGEAIEVTEAGDGAALMITLGPEEVRVYRG